MLASRPAENDAESVALTDGLCSLLVTTKSIIMLRKITNLMGQELMLASILFITLIWFGLLLLLI
jgi:hypothetical protein